MKIKGSPQVNGYSTGFNGKKLFFGCSASQPSDVSIFPRECLCVLRSSSSRPTRLLRLTFRTDAVYLLLFQQQMKSSLYISGPSLPWHLPPGVLDLSGGKKRIYLIMAVWLVARPIDGVTSHQLWRRPMLIMYTRLKTLLASLAHTLMS